MLAAIDWSGGFEDAWRDVAAFVPKLAAFLFVLLVGYVIAKALGRVTDRLLERTGFDRAVERGGIRTALARSRMDASDIVAKIVFYAAMLFVLTLGFGIFGQNPVSEMLTGVVAFLPKLIVAVLIVVVASAIAAAVKGIVGTMLGGLSYGRALATAAGASVLAIGVFAALNQVEVAPEIVNGLFYAMLAIIAGSAIIAIGGGGITPMQAEWKRALTRLHEEAPKVRREAAMNRQPGEAATVAPDAGMTQPVDDYERTLTRTQRMRPPRTVRSSRASGAPDTTR